MEALLGADLDLRRLELVQVRARLNFREFALHIFFFGADEAPGQLAEILALVLRLETLDEVLDGALAQLGQLLDLLTVLCVLFMFVGMVAHVIDQAFVVFEA